LFHCTVSCDWNVTDNKRVCSQGRVCLGVLLHKLSALGLPSRNEFLCRIVSEFDDFIQRRSSMWGIQSYSPFNVPSLLEVEEISMKPQTGKL
jgi:hypothetical protein